MFFGIIDFLQKKNKRIQLCYYDSSGWLVFKLVFWQAVRMWIDPIFKPLKGWNWSEFFDNVIDQKWTTGSRAEADVLATSFSVTKTGFDKKNQQYKYVGFFLERKKKSEKKSKLKR
mgnify:CR=1 FL=1